jgi:malonate-semialdehyde dehydrogenase (acetylating)/methylmalonate-semialdehyde dehydrogenase
MTERLQNSADMAAPMSNFLFSGWGERLFGVGHAPDHNSVVCYTQTKIVVERWPRDWSRKF